MKSFLRDLRIANIARELERDPEGLCDDMLYRSVELGGECGETLEACKKLTRKKYGIGGNGVSMSDLVDEIGDVMIALDLLCKTLNVDIEAAARSKFNKTTVKLGLKTLMEEPAAPRPDPVERVFR
jgi:NTP pyrophosphatase (non-canonical NTP hydrolase)